MPGIRKDKVQHGEEGDPYFVEENKRRCAGKCEKILPLSWFYPTIKDGHPHVTLFCKACLPEFINAQVESEKSKTAVARVNAIRDMGSALKSVLSKPVTRDDGPSIVELATQTIMSVVDKKTGSSGQQAFAEMVAREVGEIYEHPVPCIKTRLLRHKWASLMIDMQAIVAKVKAEETKVGDLNDEQLAALLEFASKQAVLDSPEIRSALLEDPEVRASLLAELGLETIDTEAVPQ